MNDNSNNHYASRPLGIDGFVWADLHDPVRLGDLDERFIAWVKDADSDLYQRFLDYRKNQGDGISPQQISALLVALSEQLGAFIARLFQVESECQQQKLAIQSENELIFGFRQKCVLPAIKRLKKTPPANTETAEALRQMQSLSNFPGYNKVAADDAEMAFCRLGLWLEALIAQMDATALCAICDWWQQQGEGPSFESLQSANDAEEIAPGLRTCIDYAIHALCTTQIIPDAAQWRCLKVADKVAFDDLVPHTTVEHEKYIAWHAPATTLRRRDGFALTDHRYDERQVQYEIEHCIYCHDRDTDSCSKGMRNKKTNTYKSNPLGVTITGCPLEEKISEMHWVKKHGDNIAALALIIIDNPLCPGTGHRICNDCMKGCIYQKTEPVNIPQVETNALTDVLFMPWGFEIYSLLTRWNPLNVKRPFALPCNGKRVLVVGLGPAGYTLAHYLLNEGFTVVGIDALKLEPLSTKWTGTSTELPQPIIDFSEHYEKLDKRITAGFGGVAEYGITVRWDKNFLYVIYLNLLRNRNFKCFGGVRFGGTLTIEDAWQLGFDHIALATGAGKPTIIGMRNNLTRGVRKASDFLMALQLTGAAKRDSLANLQIRLPAGIIGGGLTAIDTTTEVMAYYPVQVEKTLQRYESMQAVFGEEKILAAFDEEERLILEEFLCHGRAIRKERKRAATANELPDFRPLIEQWGGVTLFYRKGIQASPAYRQNHEEIREALQEGIRLVEGMSPEEAMEDQYGALQAVLFKQLQCNAQGNWEDSGKEISVPLRSLFIAAGTAPNTIYQQEYPGTFKLARRFFQRYQPEWQEGEPLPELHTIESDSTVPKIDKPAPFTSWQKDGKYISFYGDNHPVYAGNVVKAMASARDGYPYIVRLFRDELARLDHSMPAQRLREQGRESFFSHLSELWEAEIVTVKRLTSTIVEVIVHAPMQARKFQPGQFYRVQNLETKAPVIEDTRLVAEGLALTGAWVDKEKGLISLITLEMGASSRLCALWQAGDRLCVMGVTGTPTRIPKHSVVLLIGGGLGNAVQFSIGKALRAAGSQVIYFAGYKRNEDVFKMEEIEAAADIVVWAVDATGYNTAITVNRPQDRSYVGNVIDAIEAYASGKLGDTAIDLKQVEHVIAIGSDRMMKAVKEARHGRLQPWLNPAHKAIGSINSPMQCMMKGICAQCLCRHVSPKSGEPYYVYSCYNQDQDLDRVDFTNLNARLRQNSVQEKLSNLWMDYLFEKKGDNLY